jgi:hypothetical protein
MREADDALQAEICTTAMRGLKMHLWGIRHFLDVDATVNVGVQTLAVIVAEMCEDKGDAAFCERMAEIFPRLLARARARIALEEAEVVGNA